MPGNKNINEYYSCAFLHDPNISISLPKYKILLTYEEETVEVFGCSILLRADLDKTALYCALENSKKYKRNLNKYFTYVFKNNEEIVCLKFNNNKYMFEMI